MISNNSGTIKMLEMLRNASTGWLAKGLIGLLVLSFAVWGVSGSLFFGIGNAVVKVGETVVTQEDLRFAYENQLARLSQNFGRRLTRQEADALGLRQSVVSQLVNGAVLDEYSRKMALGISDQNLAKEIASVPAFQDLTGNFSRVALQTTLRRIGLSEADYVEDSRNSAIRTQLEAGTIGDQRVPEAFVSAYASYQNQTREIEYVLMGAEAVEDKPTPDAEQSNAYYEENKSVFVAPEYRKINILAVTGETLAEPDQVTEEEIAEEYEHRKDNLKTPEKRVVEQLVFADRDEALAGLEKLENGTSFEELVTGSGKKIEDISLGLVEKSALPDKAVADVAFAAKPFETSEIVEGVFGPVIIRVTKIEEAKTTPLEEVRDALRTEIANRQAVEQVYEVYEAVEDERGAGETIAAVAEKLKLEILTIDAVDRNGNDTEGQPVEGVPNLVGVLAGAFESEPGDDTQAVEADKEGFVWYDVLDVTPQRQKEFAEVKEEVEAAWLVQAVNKQVGEIADEIAKRVNAGEDFDVVLAEALPKDSFGQAVTFTKSQPLTRDDKSASNLPEQVRLAGFELQEGRVESMQLSDGSRAVLRVASIGAGDDSPVSDEVKQQLDGAAGQDLLTQVVRELQSIEPATINYQVIDAAFLR